MENPKPKQSRISRPRASAAPKVARKKKVADSAVADFLGTTASPEPVVVIETPPAPPEPEPPPIVELAMPTPQVREAPARKPTLEDVVVGIYVKVKKELEGRFQEKIAPLLARLPWIGRRFVR
jgi:hypothetical protein